MSVDRRELLIWVGGVVAVGGGARGVAAKATGKAATKPRLPPGVDPGGVAIALASTAGIDYTRPDLAPRIARDGEGELLGWDFVDNDRQPYAAASAGTALGVEATARLLLAEAGRARLMPLRIKHDPLTLGRMVVVAGQSPARILLLAAPGSARREEWAAFAEAASHFKQVMIVVPAEPVAAGAESYPTALGLPTVLTVAASDAAGLVSPAQARADLAAAVQGQATDAETAPAVVAATRVAALSARLVARDATLAGAALKQRILALTAPLPAVIGSHALRWLPAPDAVERR